MQNEVNMTEEWPVPMKIRKFYAFPYFYKNYSLWLKPEIIEINLLHEYGKCYLEIISKLPQLNDPDENQKLIQKIDLSFISDIGSESIFQDAKIFIEEFDPYSIIMTLPIFTESACEFINACENIDECECINEYTE